MTSPIRLRPHHLLCLLTWRGCGYNPDFTANMNRLSAALAAGASFYLSTGADDICAPLAGDPTAHCHGESVQWRDQQALADITSLLARDMELNTAHNLSAAEGKILQHGFKQGTLRAACKGCEWHSLCSEIAKEF